MRQQSMLAQYLLLAALLFCTVLAIIMYHYGVWFVG